MKSALIFIIIILFSAASLLSQELPPVHLDYASYAVSADGKVIGYFGNQRRVQLKSTSEVSKYVLWSLIATEDRDFYNHDGVSVKGLIRGILKTITGSTQGGSTLTMQLARNLFLSHERSIGRKINEIELAKKLEAHFTKDQILLLYLNTVYFGRGAYGIWAAAQEYFQKTPDKLDLAESAVLVGLLQSPSGYDAERKPDKLLSRRNEVLHNLIEVGKLSEKEYNRLRNIPLNINLRQNTGRHFLEYVRKEAVEILKEKGLKLSADQLKITTTLDYSLQEISENNIRQQWDNLPEKMKTLQIGFVSVEPSTGFIKAMIGGNPEADARGLNRAVQIKRQPGSSFKAFLYGSMIEDGFTTATPLLDSPIVVDKGKPTEWSPNNSDDSYSGKFIPMITAVQHSVNLAAAYAITKIINPDSVVSFAERCGIKSYIPPYPSIALGTAEVSPIEMAEGYAVFASYGTYADPVSILKIEGQDGSLIYSSSGNRIYVIDSADCYLITSILQTVIDSGTASVIRKYFKGPAAGKTGTTQNSTDVWFVGYTPELSTAIWMGYDSPKQKLTGGFQYGGSVCAPLWGKIMKQHSVVFNQFYNPDKIEEIELCVETGQRATDNCLLRSKSFVNSIKIPDPCYLHSLKEIYELHHSF